MSAFISKLTRRTAIAVIASTVALPALAQSRPVDVLELFTSQGCSSCPPADKLLGALAGNKDVLALSFNVDYWDYLGWKDTLASPEHTARQYAYARARGDRRVYTPQMIVNGAVHVVGSDRSGIESARRNTRHDLGTAQVPISISMDDGAVRVEVAEGKRWMKPATVVLIAYASAQTIAIKRGENRGRQVEYHNVVRKAVPLGQWSGKPITLTLDRTALGDTKGLSCAVILQTGDAEKPGPILGAAIATNPL